MNLTDEIKEMQEYLEQTTPSNPDELIERVGMLNVIMARSGKLLADAKAVQDGVIAKIFDNNKELISAPATVANKFISSHAKEANYLVNLLDRINRTCVHQADNLRTIVSFAKQDLALQRKGY